MTSPAKSIWMRVRGGSVIFISTDLNRFPHLDLDLNFDLDLDVFVLDRFSRASCLLEFTSRLMVHVEV